MNKLTSTERRVLELVVEGYANKEIAVLLPCSLRTVENHVTSIREKLGARNRTHAAVIYVRAMK